MSDEKLDEVAGGVRAMTPDAKGGGLEFSDLGNTDNEIAEESEDKRFVRYKEEIGRGSYKTVYKGYDTDEGVEVAWNKLPTQKMQEKDRDRVREEIAILKKMDHPNIIRCTSAWVDRATNNVNFITELMTSGSLREYVKRTKRTPKLKIIQKWSKQILNGLDYLHTQTPPIIHRDLKCDNIFINGNQGDVKLGDFGLSTLQEGPAQSVIGTPEFMAPEMYSESYSVKVDIYAFGMCLLEITTGKHPFSECQNAAQIFKKVTAGEQPDGIKDVEEGIVRQVIDECLADQDARPTAAMLLTHAFLTEEQLAPAPAPVPVIVVPDARPVGPEPEPELEPEPEPEPEEAPVQQVVGTKPNDPVQTMSVDKDLSSDGVIAVSMKIHVRGLLTKVDFKFDVVADRAETVANEMALDLQITKEQHMQVIEFIVDAVRNHNAGVMPCVKTVVQSGSAGKLADAPVSGQIPPAGPASAGVPDGHTSPVRPTGSAVTSDAAVLGPIRSSPSTQSNASNASMASYASASSTSPTSVGVDAEVSGYATGQQDGAAPAAPRSHTSSPPYSDKGGSENSRSGSAKDLLDFLDAEPATAEQLEAIAPDQAPSGTAAAIPTPAPSVLDSSLEPRGALDASIEPRGSLDASIEPIPAPTGSEPLATVKSTGSEPTPPLIASVASAGGSSAPLDLIDFSDAEEQQRADAPAPRMSPTPQTASDAAGAESVIKDTPVAPLVTLSVGTDVLVVGLLNAAQHNGKKGVIRSYDAAKVRYVVEVTTGEQLSLRPANVQLPEVKKDPFESLNFTSSKSDRGKSSTSISSSSSGSLSSATAKMSSTAAAAADTPSSPLRAGAASAATDGTSGTARGDPAVPVAPAPSTPPKVDSSLDPNSSLEPNSSIEPVAAPVASSPAPQVALSSTAVVGESRAAAGLSQTDRMAIPGTANGVSGAGLGARGPVGDAPADLSTAARKVSSSQSNVGSPDKTQIEELLKSAKKEDILRMQKLLNATVASMDDSLEPQDGDGGGKNGSGGPQHGEGGNGVGGGNGHCHSQGGGIPVPTADPEAPLERWMLEHIDTADPEGAHETADVVTSLLDAKLRAISQTGLDTLGKPSGGGGAPASR
eukprot:COSAG02_NODE_596_length_19794_cov_14.707591_16_plen_1106_part_00